MDLSFKPSSCTREKHINMDMKLDTSLVKIGYYY